MKTRYRHSDPMVVIIGPMGAGKSTVGRRLAKQLGVDFVDLDREIENETASSIVEIFATHGEGEFRRLETAMLKRYSDATGIVVSTGGGAILSSENRQIMRKSLVVYLNATPVQQYERVKNRKHRPNLDPQRPLERLTELMEIREPLYRKEADFTVHTDSKPVGRVVELIENYLLNT